MMFRFLVNNAFIVITCFCLYTAGFFFCCCCFLQKYFSACLQRGSPNVLILSFVWLKSRQDTSILQYKVCSATIFFQLDLEPKVKIVMVLIDIALLHEYTCVMVGKKAWHVMVSCSFQNFCFNVGEKYICFYSK